MKNRKYSMITLRVTELEKTTLENHSFISGLSISDIIRESLKLYLENDEMFETTKEKRLKEWIL